MAHGGYVYIISNKNLSTLYIGVTSELYSRITQHKSGVGSSFTSRYNCDILLYYKFFPTIEEAIEKEKQLKKWKRDYKVKLILDFNPSLKDLYHEVEDFN
jgi:putative endonuclease